jgi:hypothetical protein
MSVHLKIEHSDHGLLATILQRNDDGKVTGSPSVGVVASKAEAKENAKKLARSLGLKVYGFVDKTGSGQNDPPDAETEKAKPEAGNVGGAEERPPWEVPGVGKSL